VILIGLIALAFVFASAGNAVSQVILDQHLEPAAGNLSSGIDSGFSKAQTFTVGVTGVLARIEVLLALGNGPGDLLVDVRPTSGAVPVESAALALASARLPFSTVPPAFGFVSVDLSSFAAPVTTGEVLAIVLRAENASFSWLGDAGSNSYPAGAHYFEVPGFSSWAPTVIGNDDMGFRTFVDVSAVPEPSSLTLIALGAIGLIGSVWRRWTGEHNDDRVGVSGE
jgi:hypothetical protein